ncbi:MULTISPECIES: tripartite tricarboxylate transporter substrate binding protein [unclassified Chelatococcus]|uniref:Bug family tripartite tricarboxylate transporter substrate binding protein n=1 Tax=unclassified Chelatococcus TaxID=2638111 RepID=UPI0002E01401|nr:MULTISPECIES: tripartite tricarboxylate transporter substrate binding protein [unclassified Chelatococcus]ALA20387.1 C4-dicarboxylate ABC transporter substrate-binding protein [Chelatococcus sp. CO-6]
MLRPVSAILGACALLAAGAAAAQDFPARPVQVIVPYAAGGGTDLSARIMADVFQKHLKGPPMVIRNQPGGGGAIGTSAALHARPDGYTLGMGAQGPLALLPHYGGTDYKLDDVQFIALMGRNLQLVVACAKAPFSDFKAFMAYAKANPKGIQVGNSGAGGANHIAMEAFGRVAEVSFENVPFGGASEAMTACVGGHVHAMVATPAEALPHAKSGAIKPLFIMEEKRIDTFPDTPTAIEGGVKFTWSSWKGVIGPKGMPADVVAKLQEALKATFTDEDFVRRMQDLGEFVDYRDGAAYEELARNDSQTAEAIIRDLGMYQMNK